MTKKLDELNKKTVLPHTALSNFQIEKSLPGSRVVQYQHIHDFKTINQLFKKSKLIVLLYNSSETYGHWTLLIRKRGEISFFDSYGYEIDDHSSNFVPRDLNLREHNINNTNYLAKILYDFKKKHPKIKITWNEHQFQRKDQTVETCGYWVVDRGINMNLSVKEYYKRFANIQNKDNAVILLTKGLIK